jgi:hypothetical protein
MIDTRGKLFDHGPAKALVGFEIVALAVATISNWLPAYIAFVAGISVFALMSQPLSLRRSGSNDPITDAAEEN